MRRTDYQMGWSGREHMRRVLKGKVSEEKKWLKHSLAPEAVGSWSCNRVRGDARGRNHWGLGDSGELLGFILRE